MKIKNDFFSDFYSGVEPRLLHSIYIHRLPGFTVFMVKLTFEGKTVFLSSKMQLAM